MKVYIEKKFDELQFYERIPEGNYRLMAVSIYSVNELVYFNCLLEYSDVFFPALFIQLNLNKSIFSLPSIFNQIRNKEEILNILHKRIRKFEIYKLSGKPNFLIFDEDKFEKLLPLNYLNLYRFPSFITSDIGSLIRSIVRYSCAKKFLKEGDKILDFGCGTGIGSFILQKGESVRITGIDIDKAQIDFAKKLYNPSDINFIQKDIIPSGLEETYDLIVISEVLEHIENWKRILEILKENLKENGEFFITLPNWFHHQSYFNSDHRVDWTRRKIEKIFNVSPLYLVSSENPFDVKVKDESENIPLHFLFSFSKNKQEPENTSLKKILFVNHSIYPFEKTGTPLSTYEQVKQLREKGIKTGVLISDYSMEDTFKKEDLDGITIYKIPGLNWEKVWLNSFFHPYIVREYLLLIEKIVEDFDPQIVHINDYPSMFPQIVKFFSDLGCKVIRQIRSPEEICCRTFPIIEEYEIVCPGPDNIFKCSECVNFKPYKMNKYAEIFNKSIYSGNVYAHIEYVKMLYEKYVDAVIFASESFKDYFIQYIPVPENKINIIPIGFEKNVEKKIRRPEEKIIFGFLGNLTFRKGANLLCSLIEKLINDKYEGFEIRIFGEGEEKYEKRIKKLAEEKPAIVKYYGGYKYERLDEILEEIDVGLVLSYWETYSRVLREFLIRGIPVICSNFYGSEIIKDEINGFRVNTGDEEKIYNCMVKLIKNKGIVINLSKGALETYIPSKEEVDSLIRLYALLLKQSPFYEKRNEKKMPLYVENIKVNSSIFDLFKKPIASLPLTTVDITITELQNALKRIYSSHGWKILSKYYRIRDKFLPMGSKRRKFMQGFFNKIFG